MAIMVIKPTASSKDRIVVDGEIAGPSWRPYPLIGRNRDNTRDGRADVEIAMREELHPLLDAIGVVDILLVDYMELSRRSLYQWINNSIPLITTTSNPQATSTPFPFKHLNDFVRVEFEQRDPVGLSLPEKYDEVLMCGSELGMNMSLARQALCTAGAKMTQHRSLLEVELNCLLIKLEQQVCHKGPIPLKKIQPTATVQEQNIFRSILRQLTTLITTTRFGIELERLPQFLRDMMNVEKRRQEKVKRMVLMEKARAKMTPSTYLNDQKWSDISGTTVDFDMFQNYKLEGLPLKLCLPSQDKSETTKNDSPGEPEAASYDTMRKLREYKKGLNGIVVRVRDDMKMLCAQLEHVGVHHLYDLVTRTTKYEDTKGVDSVIWNMIHTAHALFHNFRLTPDELDELRRRLRKVLTTTRECWEELNDLTRVVNEDYEDLRNLWDKCGGTQLTTNVGVQIAGFSVLFADI